MTAATLPPEQAEFPDQTYNLKIELEEKGCELTPAEVEQMEGDLDGLSKLTAEMPVSDLHVTIAFFKHSGEYHVKTTLITPGKQLFTGEHDTVAHAAYQRCVRKLVQKLRNYKDRMETHNGERGKYVEHTLRELDPEWLPNLHTLESAVDGGDYAAFRKEMSGFDEPLRDRVGRWVQRYPEVDAEIGDRLPIADICEEVYLNAFERFPERPVEMRLGDWLESLVDPGIRSLLRHPDEEMEAVSFARTLREMTTSDVHTGPGGSDPGPDDPSNRGPGREVGGTHVAPLPEASDKPR